MKVVRRSAGGETRSARVVHIVQRMAPGGIETLVLDLVARSGSQDDIFSLEGSVDELTMGWPPLEAYRSVLTGFDRKPGLTPSLVGRLATRLRELSPRVVVAHHLGPLVYGGLAARIARVPCLVYVEHDVWHYTNPRARLLARAIATLTRPHYIAVSQSIAVAMRAIFRRADVKVIPPAIDTERFLPRDRNAARVLLGFDPRWKLIGTAGRLVPVKGHAVLVQALAALPECAHLVIVGDGSELERLQAIAATLGVGNRLHFLGHRDDIEQVLPACDVFCLPSLAEGRPRAVLEAQSCDLPVVASNVGGLSEAICAGTGALVPPADPIALAGALQQILSEPPERGMTREFVKRDFSWSRTLGAYESYLEI